MAWPGAARAERTWTLDADFDTGTLDAVNHDAPNNHQLQLSRTSTTEPYIWVANFVLSTVTKIDTRTGRQVAKYDSVLTRNWDGTSVPVPAPRSSCNAPSRTAVDGDGDAYVANRGFCTYDWNISTIASLTKYAGSLGNCVDRNGNGQIDTSRDANGDGRIDMNSPAEFFGQADECILWTKTYAAPGDWGRSAAVDADQNVWAGGFSTTRLYKLDGNTGALLQSIDPVAESGIGSQLYGIAIGPGGFIYTSDIGALRLRKINPSAPPGQRVVATVNSPVSTYGIAVDKNGIVWLGNWTDQYRGGVVRVDFNARTAQVIPAPSNVDCSGFTRGVAVDGNGDVWVACWTTSRLLRYNSSGIFIASYPVGAGPLGVAVDGDQKIWTVNYSGDSATRYDPATGTTASFPTSGTPYSYSDMTGFQQRNFTQRQGIWTAIHDSGNAGTEWGTVHWNREPQGSTPAGTTITVYARAADSTASLDSLPYVEMTNGAAFTGTFGRYIQVKAVLRIQEGNVSPVLSDVTVIPRPTTGWADTGPLVGCHAKALHRAVRLNNGQVLAVGGYNTNTDLYDPASGTWRATTSISRARRYHTATLLPDGRVLVTGGANGSLDATAELYDSTSETWTPAASMTRARRHHTATLLPDGRVLVAGGAGSGQSATAELYDPATNTWTATGSMNQGRRQHTATLLPGGRVLVAAGANDSGTVLASAEVYDPATSTWTAVGNLGQARYYHTATALPGGRVLVAGGNGDKLKAATAEVFDPASATWSFTGSMVQPRRFHTATLLTTGKVLVAGGYHDYTGIHTAAELYNPATGTWSSTVPMSKERYHHTATLLTNGKVLAAGGFSNTEQGSAELYTP